LVSDGLAAILRIFPRQAKKHKNQAIKSAATKEMKNMKSIVLLSSGDSIGLAE
jgi:hypothetical protein